MVTLGSLAAAQEKRRHPRVDAPIYCMPKGPFCPGPVVDISLGGARVYCDDEKEVGDELKLEMLFPDKHIHSCDVTVVWVKNAVSEKGPVDAHYEMGLKFNEVPDTTISAMKRCIKNSLGKKRM